MLEVGAAVEPLGGVTMLTVNQQTKLLHEMLERRGVKRVSRFRVTRSAGRVVTQQCP